MVAEDWTPHATVTGKKRDAALIFEDNAALQLLCLKQGKHHQ